MIDDPLVCSHDATYFSILGRLNILKTGKAVHFKLFWTQLLLSDQKFTHKVSVI